MRRTYNNNNKNYQARKQNMNDSHYNNNDKEDAPIERSQHLHKENAQDSHDNMFVREPDDKKKSEIKVNTNKWTKHFKEIGKNDNIKIMNNIRMNLNILTPDNFAKIKLVIVELVKGSEDNLKMLVDMIIEKAWNEPKYITTYANLCSFLENEKSLQASVEKPSEETKKQKNKSLFKSFLLGRIQKAFEKQEFMKEKG